MKNALYLIFIACFLSACSSVPVSEQMTIQAKNDLNKVEGVIDELEHNLSTEEKSLFKSDLNAVKSQIKEVEVGIDNINNSCKAEKQVLKEQINTKNWLIVFLVGVISALSILLFKKK